ncbi:MAG: 23S rRNA (guanosine(2251)-2'-O)-methyltransferase RlmB [Pseudomonadota bacterium]|nr:23S rRNA (guanosine(2251)-2'-O)-methyltransferase RlmB [Pseudomonadota bacterium]
MTEGNDNRGGGPRGRAGGGAGRGGSRGDRPGGGFRGARPGGDRPREGGFRGPRRENGDRPQREGGFRGPRREDGDRPQRAPRENRGDDGAPRPERPFREDKRGRNHFREGAQRPPKREERDGPARRLPTVEVRGGGRQGGQQQEATHWIYGRHAVLAALANPRRQVQRLIATPQFIEETPLGQHNLLETMSRTDMDAVLARYDREGASHGGIAAYASTLNPPSTEALLKGEGPAIVVVLDQVSDPHNTGAILRTAAAFGARAVIAPERNAAPVTGSLAKAASGALETVPYLRPTNLARTLAMLKEWGYWRIGLDGAATHNIAEARKFDRIALVLGSEGKGLRRLTAENCDMLVSIPISEAVESLNVSNATAIALYALKS